ncbi:transcriptional repressor LexA [Streptomyces sp. NPDC001832]|uniref:transcriptional repressor LexA n=1 Tax=Streptomyces sp. NPDC001832 TaxID=3154527 RepID=UPI00332408A4
MHAVAAIGRPGRPPGGRVGPEGLTDRQRAVVACIKESLKTRGYPPSMREIGQFAGLSSTSSVAHQLSALERKGVLRKDPHRPRAYVIAEREAPYAGPAFPAASAARSSSVGKAPVVGRIAAGVPIPAEESVEDIPELPRRLTGSGELFILKVSGDSMAGEGAILDGDWVVVRKQHDAEHGSIVAAMIDGEATVKRLKRDGANVWLMPDNKTYERIWGNRATILGKVVTVLRNL